MSSSYLMIGLCCKIMAFPAMGELHDLEAKELILELIDQTKLGVPGVLPMAVRLMACWKR